MEASNTLRGKVVNFILADGNFESFRFILQDRVYERKTTREINDMATECKFFVRCILSRNKCWGGRETSTAVSKMFRLNLIVFYVNSPTDMICNNEEKYEHTMAVAFRLSLKPQVRRPYLSLKQ